MSADFLTAAVMQATFGGPGRVDFTTDNPCPDRRDCECSAWERDYVAPREAS